MHDLLRRLRNKNLRSMFNVKWLTLPSSVFQLEIRADWWIPFQTWRPSVKTGWSMRMLAPRGTIIPFLQNLKIILELATNKLLIREANLRDIFADLRFENDIQHLDNITRHLVGFAIHVLGDSLPIHWMDFANFDLAVPGLLLWGASGLKNKVISWQTSNMQQV